MLLAPPTGDQGACPTSKLPQISQEAGKLEGQLGGHELFNRTTSWLVVYSHYKSLCFALQYHTGHRSTHSQGSSVQPQDTLTKHPKNKHQGSERQVQPRQRKEERATAYILLHKSLTERRSWETQQRNVDCRQTENSAGGLGMDWQPPYKIIMLRQVSKEFGTPPRMRLGYSE